MISAHATALAPLGETFSWMGAELLGPFHGLHAAPPQARCEKVTWREPSARCVQARIRRHTCECKPTVYELCVSGGLVFIRRTVRTCDGVNVRETEWLRSARAVELWLALLAGQAR